MKRHDASQKKVSGQAPEGRGRQSGSFTPHSLIYKKKKRPSSRLALYLKTSALALLCIYISVPFIIRLFPALLAKVVYLNILKVPFSVDLSNPKVILNHTTNFYLTTEDGITVGVWHTLPASRWEEAKYKDQVWYEEALSDVNPVIIYLHGNGGTRAVDHRVQLVKVLSAAGFHVLSLDYRGYADSTGEPTEEGITMDSVYLYEWVKARSRGTPVCIWGHSLGTGVATNAARKLQEKGSAVDVVILESPYTNIREAGAYHPFGRIYHSFPGFEYFFLDTFALNNIVFPNDENVKLLNAPILILHAEDDAVVPSFMAKKLHDIALKSQNSRGVKLVLFRADLDYEHENIYKDPKLPEIIWDFLNDI
ncbi:lysophosphatidylserine lipase ABHD12 isoform X2 [Xenopus laevis]|uniref:Lysophosphatidylserine lipase ABHD12 isoform X2 n=1 Tax=Xenopus laevis TaxID=8355 RepID=A0A8J1LHE1_XENLA|nr:lysophosphatidylserine lipase ABHD12 isoform X2 [Xenopus laevis]